MKKRGVMVAVVVEVCGKGKKGVPFSLVGF